MHNNSILIFTDGSARGNPGPGGFAAIIIFPKGENNDGGARNDADSTRTNADHGTYFVIESGGREEHTTNNRMELRAAIEALRFLQGQTFSPIQDRTLRTIVRLSFYTDSSYLVNGITKWIRDWQNNGWMTKEKKPVLNADLWKTLSDLASNKIIDWHLTEGHVGVSGNERADVLATAFADARNPKLFSGPLSDYPIKNILDFTKDKNLSEKKGHVRNHSRAKAFSYVSLVEGVVETHKTWGQCEKRVKGKKARFRKVFSEAEEHRLIEEFSKK